MYLHKDDKELFHDIIVTVSEKSGIEENTLKLINDNTKYEEVVQCYYAIMHELF